MCIFKSSHCVCHLFPSPTLIIPRPCFRVDVSACFSSSFLTFLPVKVQQLFFWGGVGPCFLPEKDKERRIKELFFAATKQGQKTKNAVEDMISEMLYREFVSTIALESFSAGGHLGGAGGGGGRLVVCVLFFLLCFVPPHGVDILHL